MFGLSLAILQLFACVGLHAQTPTYYLDSEKSLAQYNIDSWTTEDGLPTNSLLSLCQTSDGYLWISSYDGLIRFDGNEFLNYNKSNVKEFETNTIRKLAEGTNGELWMTTQGNGLVSHKNGRFIRYGKEQGINNLYRAIYVDKQNKVWSASPDKGWFFFSKGKFSFLKHSKSLENIEVRSIECSEDGDMWFGTFGKGLYKYSNGTFTEFTQAEGLVNNWVYSLFYDSEGLLWVGTSNGLCYYNGDEFVTVGSLKGLTINGLFEDKHHSLWIATNNGLYRKRNGEDEAELLTTVNGLPHNFINDFLMDIEGNVWMAFYKGGLGQIKDGKFTNYTQAAGLQGKVVNAICEIAPNIILASFDNGEFSRIQDDRITKYKIKTKLSGERIRHILKDSKGNLWFSTYSGLLKVTPSGKEKWYTDIPFLAKAKVRVSFEDSKGNLWVGTRNSGVVKISPDNSHQVYNATNGLSANLIMSIDEDNKGRILVGTSEGESGFNIISADGSIQNFSSENGFVANVVFNSYCDKEGSIWVAAIGGVSLIRGEKVFNFTSSNGLGCDSPFDILEDDFGHIWLPCSKGVMRLNKAELLQFADGTSDAYKCDLFDRHDGMVEEECNATSQSIKTSDGKLWFPTINGIAQIDPGEILTNNYLPPVYIKNIVADGNTLSALVEQKFEPGVKRLTFNYTAVSLYEPERIAFKYKLEGFDTEWIDAGSSRSISYTNLKHGAYQFQVMATNSDLVFNPQTANFSFEIKPAFYNTIAFYLLCLLLLSAFAYGVYRLRIKQLKKKQFELEVEVKKQTSEISEQNQVLESQKAEIEAQKESLEDQKRELNLLNASKDKMFSIIGHDLRGPLGNFRTILDMMVNTPQDFDDFEREELLKMLSQNAQLTYELLENILNWSSTQRGVITYEPTLVNPRAVSEHTLQFMTPMAVNKNIEIVSLIDESVEIEADENMLRALFRNLIGNAIKFTRENGRIEVVSEMRNGKPVIGVKDSGVGIAPEIMEKLFRHTEHTVRVGTNEEKGSGLGLLLCKEFVERHGGKIWVESELGYGSTFYFTLGKGRC